MLEFSSGRSPRCSCQAAGRLPWSRMQEPFAPGFEVVVGDDLQHRLVAAAAFLERHGERLRDGAGDRFRIIGIDEQGARMLRSRRRRSATE